MCICLKYDPNRTCYLALVKYFNGAYSYILSPYGLFNGAFIKNCQSHKIYNKGYKVGYSVFIFNIGINCIFFNVELIPSRGGQYIRSAGTYGIVIRKDKQKGFTFIKMPTGIIFILTNFCVVTLGRSSNILHKKEVPGKAGYNRNKGIRPCVRGVAMNPVDHPHGGRTKSVSPEVTPWGKIAKRNR